MPIRHFNILQQFITVAHQHPTKDALLYSKLDSYQSLTYLSIYQHVLAFAHELRDNGVVNGDRVAVVLENRPEFSWVCLGVFAVGGIIVPLDIQSTSDVLSKLIEHSGAKVVVSTEKFLVDHESGVKGKWICIDSLNILKHAQSLGDEIDIDFDFGKQETAAFFYTSGTTSFPKAVMLSHQNLVSNVDSIMKAGFVNSNDVVVSMLPLHHTYAFTVTLLCPLLLGMTIAYPKSLSSADLLSCIKQTCTTVFVGVPQVFAMIHRSIREHINQMAPAMSSMARIAGRMNFVARELGNCNLGSAVFKKIHQRFGPSLRMMVSGGARLDPAIAKDFYQWGFNLVEGYGLTETSPVVSFSIAAKPRFGSVGRPLPGVDVRIDSPDADGKGEVLVRGLNVMQGYYRDADQTNKVLRHGWFYTGDLGRFDEEGFLYLTGRKKEMLVLSNGENINPEEIEAYYAQDPFIKEIAVLTIRDNQKAFDLTRLVAIIVPEDEQFRAEQELHIRKRLKWELENYAAKLPTYKHIRGFVISQEGLPRTRLGKLKRFELERIFYQLQEGADASKKKRPDMVYSEFSKDIMAFSGQYIGRLVVPDDHLELDLGLDSLGRLEFLAALQKHFGVSLKEEDAQQLFICATIGQLLDQAKIVLRRYGVNVDNVQSAPKGFSPMAKSALTYLEEQAGRDISLNDHLELDLGLDSLSRMEILLGIQQQLSLALTEEDALRFFMCNRVGDLLDELDRVVNDSAEYRAAVIDWRNVLFENPKEQERHKISFKPLNFLERVFSGFVLGWFKFLFKLCFHISVEGREKLPHHGPFILCANHNSYFDGLFIATTLPFSIAIQTFFLGDSKFFDNKFLKFFQKIARLIPIEFTHRMVDALKLCSYVLRHDKVLCYFPEGQRSIDGRVKEFRKGIGILIYELDVPVVPVYIEGAFHVWPRGRKWPRFGKVTVRFGQAVSAKDLAFKMVEAEDVYSRVSENLRENVLRLANQ